MKNPRGLTDISQGAIYSPNELIEVFKLKKGQIVKLCKAGKLKSHKAGKQWLIPGSSVVLYFASIVGKKSGETLRSMGVKK